MSLVAIGRHQYRHYHQLSDNCQLMSCDHAGVNVDYFTLVVQAAGFTAIPYEREISDQVGPEFASALANGTADVGWALKMQDPNLLDKVFFTFPLTRVTYGYLVQEDRAEIRESFLKVLFNSGTIIFVMLMIAVNIINIMCNGLEILKKREKLNLKSTVGIISAVAKLYKANPQYRNRNISSRTLLSLYLFGVLLFTHFFQSKITSILASDEIRGYDVTSFPEMGHLDFNLYWKDGLLRGDVVVYNRILRHLFVVDHNLSKQPFSFYISRKRRDLVEAFNRAIAWTSPIYPLIMSRYISPYGVYSRRIANMEVTPLKLSNFDSVWQFFAVCVGIIVAVFFLEVVVGNYIRSDRNRKRVFCR